MIMFILFILHMLLPSILCDIATGDDMMLVVDCALNRPAVNGTIYISSAMTSDNLQLTALPLTNLRNPVAVDYDPLEGRIYWTDYTDHSISRAYLNGSHQEKIVSDLGHPTGLAINPIADTLYWTDEDRQTIGMANLDGTNQTILFDNLLQSPRPIIINYKSGHIYWAQWHMGGDGSKIQRALSDGSEATVLIDSDLMHPNGLTLDMEGGYLYWCDGGTNKIERSTLSGEERIVILHINYEDIKPFDISLYKEYLYWTDWTNPYIQRNTINPPMNTTSDPETVGPRIFNMGCGIHIHKASQWKTIRNPNDDEYAHVNTSKDHEYAQTTTIITSENDHGEYDEYAQVNTDNYQEYAEIPKAIDDFIIVTASSSSSDTKIPKISHYLIISASVAVSVLLVGIALLLTYHKINTFRHQAIYATEIPKCKDTTVEIYDTISESKQNGDYETYIKSADSTSGTQFDNPEYSDTMNRFVGCIANGGAGGDEEDMEPRYSNQVQTSDEISLLGPPKPPSIQTLDRLVTRQDKGTLAGVRK